MLHLLLMDGTNDLGAGGGLSGYEHIQHHIASAFTIQRMLLGTYTAWSSPPRSCTFCPLLLSLSVQHSHSRIACHSLLLVIWTTINSLHWTRSTYLLLCLGHFATRWQHTANRNTNAHNSRLGHVNVPSYVCVLVMQQQQQQLALWSTWTTTTRTSFEGWLHTTCDEVHVINTSGDHRIQYRLSSLSDDPEAWRE